MQSGLSLLQKELNISPNSSNVKAIIENTAIPIYSFIAQLIEILKEYVHSDFRYSWAQYLICNKKPQIFHLVRFWGFHNKHSLESQLLNSLLLITDPKKCRLFLRLRKYVLQLSNINMLDEIVLRHEDVISIFVLSIAIVHRMFPPNIKREIMNGIKQIFISYKVTQAKIYACVFIEYILSIYDSIGEGEQSYMVGDTKLSSNIVISNFSTINKFNSNIHKDNGLYRKLENSQNAYIIIETKFLPQKLQKQRTKFQEEPNGNEYYSNSLNFSEESKYYNYLPKITQKENLNQNQSLLSKAHEKNSQSFEKDHEQRQEIKIEDESEYSHPYLDETSQHFSIRSINKSIQSLMMRNQEFKSRLLSGKTSVKMELSHEEEDSISETINIIHNSIVRNRRERA